MVLSHQYAEQMKRNDTMKRPLSVALCKVNISMQ